ncbi:MAG: response regulator [bacterium]
MNKKQCLTSEAYEEIIPVSSKKASAKILVVDDDPDFVEITKLILESNNYEVISASNGSEGINVARREKPNLVILDVMMSSILDGLDMSWKMQENNELKHIPILMVTSIAHTDYATLFPIDQYIHIDGFISKPVPPDKLLNTIRRILV